MSSYLDKDGLTYLWGKIKEAFAAKSHTHAAGDITSGTLAGARIPNLAASKITSGTFAAARIPTATASAIGGVKVGSGLAIADGVLSATGGGSGGYCQASGSSSSVALASGTITQIPLVASGAMSSGSGFSIASGGIRCDFDGAVRVSASAYVNAPAAVLWRAVHVQKGTSFQVGAAYNVLSAVDAKPTTTAVYAAVSSAPKVVSVGSGDILFLAARCMSAAGTCDATNESTYLLVERVE